MHRLAIAIIAVVAITASAFVYASRDTVSKEQAHICQLAKDAVRAASPNPAKTAFSPCGDDGMLVIRTSEDTYGVHGSASITNLDGDVIEHLFMMSAWRTADGWETNLDYFAEKATSSP